MPPKEKHFIAENGINLPNLKGSDPPELRFEEGDEIPASAIPPKSLKWLLEDGEISDPSKKKEGGEE